MAISDYYMSLDRKAKNDFRDKVLLETGIAYPTFFYKIKNNSWTKSEERVINDIINNNGDE